MALTYKLIASSTVGSGGAASIDFTSIPQTYTDLKVVVSSRNSNATNRVYYNFNGATTNQSARLIYGDGNSAASDTDTRHWFYGTASSYTANTFGNGEVYIPNYTGSTNKSSSSDSLNENNATGAYMALAANLWSQTNAITSITFTPDSGNFAQYSTFYLYGIKNS